MTNILHIIRCIKQATMERSQHPIDADMQASIRQALISLFNDDEGRLALSSFRAAYERRARRPWLPESRPVGLQTAIVDALASLHYSCEGESGERAVLGPAADEGFREDFLEAVDQVLQNPGIVRRFGNALLYEGIGQAQISELNFDPLIRRALRNYSRRSESGTAGPF